MKRKSGFTLVELMVVVLIISIISVVLVMVLRGNLNTLKYGQKKIIKQKDNPQSGENICKIYNWQLINLQNIQAACSSIPKKKKKKHTTQSKNRILK